MNRSSLLTCIVLLFALTATAQTPEPQTQQADRNTWKTYNVKGEKVSASFPTHPAMTTTTRYQAPGNKKLTDRMVGAYADGVVYALYTYDNAEPQISLEDFVVRERGIDRGDVANVRNMKLDRYAGKEYSTVNNGLAATTQFFAVKDRHYKFSATGVPADDPRVKQFFSSITFDQKGELEVSDGPGILLPTPPVETGTSQPLFVGRQVDSKARLVMKPEPSYTDEARQQQIVGTVILKVVVASNGAVTNIRTFQGLPHGLTERAIGAARKIKFIPAIKDGKYVSMWIQLEYNFNLY